jgi:hypothetical protein
MAAGVDEGDSSSTGGIVIKDKALKSASIGMETIGWRCGEPRELDKDIGGGS